MEKIVAAYIAGIVDGEGSVLLMRRNSAKWPAPQVSVDSTDRELLEYLHSKVGAGHIVIKKKYAEHHSQAWTWKVVYRPAMELLKDIVPYMVIRRKVARARLLLEEYDACTPRNGKYTPEMILAKEDLVKRFYGSTP